jgi:hypothetical protein
MYAIVCYRPADTNERGYAIVGDEGRVNEEILPDAAAARRYAEGMREAGYEIVPGVYFIDREDGNGPDWETPIEF